MSMDQNNLWTGFQMPRRLAADTETLTERYGRFSAQPFERGFGTTVGNSLRRALLSSIEGAAVTAVKIEGVEHVDNQIEVLPPSPMDESLRRRLYRAIYGYPALQKYSLGVRQPIRIIVKNGKVSLEGVVDSEEDKNITNIQASSVPGIFSVTNNLRVEHN